MLSGLFWQTESMEKVSHCLCSLEQIAEVVWEQLRRTTQMKVFRLNKYENCGKILKYFDAFELYIVTLLTTGKIKLITVKDNIPINIPKDES